MKRYKELPNTEQTKIQDIKTVIKNGCTKMDGELREMAEELIYIVKGAEHDGYDEFPLKVAKTVISKGSCSEKQAFIIAMGIYEVGQIEYALKVACSDLSEEES